MIEEVVVQANLERRCNTFGVDELNIHLVVMLMPIFKFTHQLLLSLTFSQLSPTSLFIVHLRTKFVSEFKYKILL